MTVKPDQFIVTIVFDICGKLADERAFRLGRQVFSQMDESFYQSTTAMNSALTMFSRNGDVHKAKELFRSIESKDRITFGAMMKAYTLNDDPSRALALFEQMKKDNIKPDLVSYALAIHACAQIGMMQYSRSIVAQLPDHFLDDHVLRNALIDMWASGSSMGRSILYSLSLVRGKRVQSMKPIEYSSRYKSQIRSPSVQ